MKNINIFSIIVVFLLSACFPENEQNSTGVKAEAEINGQNWTASIGAYENNDNKHEIVIAGNGLVLLIQLDELKEAEFDLSEKGNQIIFIAGGQTTVIKEGNVTINSISEKEISGTFEFNYTTKAEGEHSIEAHYGSFYNLDLHKSSLSEENTIKKNKFIFVDGKAGKIDIQETECIISYTKEQFKLDIDGYEDKNLELKIQGIDENATGSILHINNKGVKSINIDKMNNNKVSILFKNETSLTIL